MSKGQQHPDGRADDPQEGVILATLPKALFRVKLESGENITAALSTQAKRITIKLLPGDRVSVETSPFDPTRGRILERL